MVTSRNPGTTSLSHKNCEDSALAQLRSLADSPILAPLKSTLGPENIFLVGGTVRDLLCGKSGVDIDLACSHSVEETKRLLEENGIRVVDTGLQHGTLTAVINHTNIEITSFRNQTSKTPSIREDLSGRDFTINAIAFSLKNFELIDPHSGLDDLEAKILRAVGDPSKRFAEDPLRILRSVRLGPAQGRALDPQTKHVALQASASLKSISVERIRVEIEKILLSSHAADGIRALLELKLLPLTIPELLPTVGFEQNEFHIHDVFEHTLWVIDRTPYDLTLRLAALFHDLGKPDTLSVDSDGRRHFYKHEQISASIAKTRMKALKFPNKQIDDVCNIVDMHMRPVNCGPAGARRLMRELGDNFEAWKVFKRADAPPKIAECEVESQMTDFDKLIESEKARLQKLGGSNLAVSGEDLIQIGIKPGVQMGKILKALNELIIEIPELNTKEELLKRAKELPPIT